MANKNGQSKGPNTYSNCLVSVFITPCDCWQFHISNFCVDCITSPNKMDKLKVKNQLSFFCIGFYNT